MKVISALHDINFWTFHFSYLTLHESYKQAKQAENVFAKQLSLDEIVKERQLKTKTWLSLPTW